MKSFTSLFVILLTILSSCSKDESINPPQTIVDHSWAPLNRTTSNINLVEEDIINVETNFVELDFYRNTAYTCGFSGNYTFWYESSQLAAKQRAQQNKK